MAGQQQHTQDGIVERRLRPIYDWLDNGNNKKALQEAEKVLKKSPTLQAARALKALALFRLGKASEAFAVLDALAEEKPSDDTTLQAMTITYRESQQLSKVCEIYSAAVKAEPLSEELHSHLFMSYVRVGDARAQQRAAMALYKFAPKNPYYFWAVMSIVLQAKATEDETRKGILLTLAQRMVDNFIAENKMEAEQEVRLYIMILELQEKWEDILNFIEGPLYSQLVPGSKAQACIPYLKKLGHWRRLNLICKELLWDNQDRWDYYLPYFDSVFELMKGNDNTANDSENCADDTAEKCHEFICQLVESISSGRALRGPYLARLELWKRLSKDGDPTALLGSGVALCVQYLRVFANKPCAVPDLRPYLAMIPQKEREEHSRDFLTCLGFDENSNPETQDDIQRHVSCFGAWRLTAEPAAPETSLRLAEVLRSQYLRCLRDRLVAATVTEFCAADGYATLAAHLYCHAALAQQTTEPLVEAASVLELALHHSPANFHAKLLLVSIYHLLGNAWAASTAYARLEAKHVQLVSLGWLHAYRLPGALAPARALRLLADTRAFHHHHAKDSIEQVTYAYKYGTFEKLVELIAWGARLDACAWSALAARERAALALLAGPPAPLHAPPPQPEVPRDNRDLKAIVNWEPPQLEDHDIKARTFEKDVAYLRLKDAIVSAIALCIECADTASRGGDAGAQCAELRAGIAALGEALAAARVAHGARERRTVAGPGPSRIVAFVNSPIPYRELYTAALSTACALCAAGAGAVVGVGVVGAEGAGEARAHAARTERLLRECAPHLTAAARPAAAHLVDALQLYSHFIEFIGIITFLLGVCNELTAPANTKKSKKKASQSPDQIKTAETLSSLNDAVQDTIALLEDIFDKWPTYDYKATLQARLAELNLDNSYQCPVERRLNDGLRDMLADVKNILKKKSKYLKSLQ